MGQKFGKATYDERIRVFVNLSLGGMEALWEAFNDVADGFGVSQYEMEVCLASIISPFPIMPMPCSQLAYVRLSTTFAYSVLYVSCALQFSCISRELVAVVHV